MSAILPIDIDALLRNRGVESERVEFKESWDERTTGYQLLATICAFANDYHNLNGGYAVVGVAEDGGRAVLPPAGLAAGEIDAAQRWIRGQCNRIDPPCFPVLSPERVGDRLILVIWAPASDTRPHRAPGPGFERGPGRFWVRLGAETVDAERRGDMLRELIQQTARVPWDDRPARDMRVEDLSVAKVREHLRDAGSGLLDESDERDIYRRMRIVSRVNDREVPRNAALLFFSESPERRFPGAKIEVVQFAADRAENTQEERTFSGALSDQLRDCLNYLENLSTFHLRKRDDSPRVHGWVNYPAPALRETLVNAVYHRGYDVDQPEPTKVCLFPDRIEITSYPGPVAGIERRHLVRNARVPFARARNRRIGEFLKAIGLAEAWLSGLPKIFRAMANNGSPAPRFEFDEQRTYFQATLPAHPEYAALSASRDAAHLRAIGETGAAFRRIESAWMSSPASPVLASEMIRTHGENGDFERAEEVFKAFEEQGPPGAVPGVMDTLVDLLVSGGESEREKARRLLARPRPGQHGPHAAEAAIRARRVGDSRLAHRYFERAGEAIHTDPRALLEFAQTKLQLAREANWKKRRDANRRLLVDAQALLERVIQLDASPTRHAWAWRELARARFWLRRPPRDVEDAWRQALALLPDEPRFVRERDGMRAARR